MEKGPGERPSRGGSERDRGGPLSSTPRLVQPTQGPGQAERLRVTVLQKPALRLRSTLKQASSGGRTRIGGQAVDGVRSGERAARVLHLGESWRLPLLLVFRIFRDLHCFKYSLSRKPLSPAESSVCQQHFPRLPFTLKWHTKISIVRSCLTVFVLASDGHRAPNCYHPGPRNNVGN